MSRWLSRRQQGFTLVELVTVIIIVGVLAAIAVPRLINLGRDARVAALKALAGALETAAINVHAACATNPTCDYSSSTQIFMIGGKLVWMNYGWLDAGDALHAGQIDDWVSYAGFTATLPDLATTRFSLDGSPTPSNCSVSYIQSFSAATEPRTVLITTGC